MSERPWIKHDNGPCPVSRDSIVDVKLRCGRVILRIRADDTTDFKGRGFVDTIFWILGINDITHYRLCDDPQAEQATREARIASFKKLADTLPDFQPRTVPVKPEKVRG